MKKYTRDQVELSIHKLVSIVNHVCKTVCQLEESLVPAIFTEGRYCFRNDRLVALIKKDQSELEPHLEELTEAAILHFGHRDVLETVLRGNEESVLTEVEWREIFVKALQASLGNLKHNRPTYALDPFLAKETNKEEIQLKSGDVPAPQEHDAVEGMYDFAPAVEDILEEIEKQTGVKECPYVIQRNALCALAKQLLSFTTIHNIAIDKDFDNRACLTFLYQPKSLGFDLDLLHVGHIQLRHAEQGLIKLTVSALDDSPEADKNIHASHQCVEETIKMSIGQNVLLQFVLEENDSMFTNLRDAYPLFSRHWKHMSELNKKDAFLLALDIFHK